MGGSAWLLSIRADGVAKPLNRTGHVMPAGQAASPRGRNEVGRAVAGWWPSRPAPRRTLRAHLLLRSPVLWCNGLLGDNKDWPANDFV